MKTLTGRHGDSNPCRGRMTLLRSLAFVSATLVSVAAKGEDAVATSKGTYRLPYADGTVITVFDDFTTHRPRGRLDFFGVGGSNPYRIVAAAAGRIMAIQDSFAEQQSGRAAADCRNNYVWIAHPNGEWTNYSHLAQGSVTELAKLEVGDEVATGDFLGIEGAVGCAMLDHLHFEVAVPQQETPIDEGGFLTDNEQGKRARSPQFCGIAGGTTIKRKSYRAAPCPTLEAQ